MSSPTHPFRRALLGLVCALAMFAGPFASGAPARAATPVIVEANWRKGHTSGSQGVCSIYLGFPTYCTIAMSRVDYRTPSGDPLVAPKVGQKFLVHVYTAIVAPSNVSVVSLYQTRVILPTGLVPAITNQATDVRCLFTDLKNIQLAKAPCGLTKSGVSWVFPAGNLVNDRQLQYFFPVVATKAFKGTATSDCSKTAVIDSGVCIQSTSMMLNNPHNLLPNPLVSWVPLTVTGTTKPGAPTKVTAASRNAAAAVAWKAPASNGGSAITKYTVTAAPGGRTCTTAGTLSCQVTGLTNGTSYTFTVKATNALGTGVASPPTAAVKVGTPTAPRSPTVTHPGAGVAKISWLAPAFVGSGAVTRYEIRARASDGTTITAWSAWSSLGLTLSTTQTGLAAPLIYDVQIRAVNATGPGAPAAIAFLQSS